MKVEAIIVLVALALGAAACGGGPSPRTSELADRPSVADSAVYLAAQLPETTESCTVARPGLLSKHQRGLVGRISQSDSFVWSLPLRMHAFAVGEQTDLAGRAATVILIDAIDDQATVRQALRSAPVRILFEDDPLPDLEAEIFDPSSFYRAEMDGSLVRLTRGTFGFRRNAVTDRCRALARSHPEALELSARMTELAELGVAELGLRFSEWRITRSPDGVRAVHVGTTRGASEANERRGIIETLEMSALAGLSPDQVTRRRRGDSLILSMSFVWEDLELLLEDEERLRRAELEEARDRLPRSVELVDVSDLSAARVEIEKRDALLAALSGRARVAAAEELVTLLARVAHAHPSAIDLEVRLSRALATEVGRPKEALARIELLLRRHPSEEGRLALLRREVLARIGPRELSAQLVADELVPASQANRAAKEIRAAMGSGVAYEWAESGWIAARQIEATARRATMRAIPRSKMSLDTALTTLATLAELGPLFDKGPRAGYVLVRTREGSLLSDADRSRDWMQVSGKRGGVLLFRAFMSDADSALDDGLAGLVAKGPLAVTFVYLRLGGRLSEADVAFTIEGNAADGQFVLARASAGASALPWPDIVRYLSKPMAEAEPRLFPPSRLIVTLKSDADAQRLLELASLEGLNRCDVAGTRVECASAAGEVDSARRALLTFAREMLGSALAGLGGRSE